MNATKHKEDQGARILLKALSDPAATAMFGVEDWDLLLRLTRHTRLLGRLAACVDDLGLLEAIPEKVVEHFMAARVFVEQHQRTARWEINRIVRALEDIDVPITLLKGSAYILAGLPPARGRLLSDVDLLFPRDKLDSVEQALKAHGWESVKIEDYDQHYYRTWMHELPPLRHPERGMEVDIHHTILPLTSRLNPDPDKLLRNSIPLDNKRLRILHPVDMVLHATVHLFHDGEFINGLRDLVDLADLLAHFGDLPGFWQQLVERARAQRLGRPLFYMLRCTQRCLDAKIPEGVLKDLRSDEPSWPVLRLMDVLVSRALIPDHPDYPQRRTALAKWLLYVRSHWLRMPPGLLFRHLLRKQYMRWKNQRLSAIAQADRGGYNG
jgi:hypothetical protein